MGRYKIDHSKRVGIVGINNHGSKMVVDEYNGAKDIWVRFLENGNRVHTSWINFLQRKVKNPYDKTICNVGFIGEGDYKVIINREYTPQYISWSSMIRRCYSDFNLEKNPSYKNCLVCDDWHNFQNFAAWYDDHFYQIDGEKMDLDKDILVKGNKVYSPETCVFVPHRINSLFVKSGSKRGILPIGVFYMKNRIKRPYCVVCNDFRGKRINLGYYSDPEQAFKIYKIHKENIIKKVAESYEEKVPKNLYAAMINYSVEITD